MDIRVSVRDFQASATYRWDEVNPMDATKGAAEKRIAIWRMSVAEADAGEGRQEPPLRHVGQVRGLALAQPVRGRDRRDGQKAEHESRERGPDERGLGFDAGSDLVGFPREAQKTAKPRTTKPISALRVHLTNTASNPLDPRASIRGESVGGSSIDKSALRLVRVGG